MNVAILYICTGKYFIFWKDFYLSAEKLLLPGLHKEYFVFSDAEHLFAEENNRVHQVFQERLGWPYDTLMRFQMFSTIEEKLSAFDYIFFFNANVEFLSIIEPKELLPNEYEELVVTLHPGYHSWPRSKFPYESKQKASSAYISKKEGRHYFAGGVNGGKAESFIRLIRELNTNIQKDLKEGIIAKWHDESHINHYVLDKNPKILSPAYIYPEGWRLPFEPKILIRDKAKHGGHGFLRDVTEKRSAFKKIKRAILSMFKKPDKKQVE